MKKINNFNVLQYMLSFGLFMGAGLSNILNLAKEDVWVCGIIGTVIGYIILFLFSKLNENSFKITSLIANIILLFFGLYSTTKLISSIYLSNTPIYFIMIPNILLVLYTVKKGLNSFLRASFVLFIFFMILMIFSAGMLAPSVDLDFFKPVLINGAGKIILGSISFAVTSAFPILLMPNFKAQYSSKCYLLSSINLLIVIVCTFGNLGPEMSELYRYPEYIVLKRISALNFIDNVENILFMIWIIVGFESSVTSSLNIVKLYGKKFFYIVILILYVLISFYLIDSYKVIDFLVRNYLIILSSAMGMYFLGKLKGTSRK
ncbi:MAG: GerAB/ArcD/ProY family transporter [bacterium]|nr:GerAB/ArcD/ProY family transporter [bacterium]